MFVQQAPMKLPRESVSEATLKFDSRNHEQEETLKFDSRNHEQEESWS